MFSFPARTFEADLSLSYSLFSDSQPQELSVTETKSSTRISPRGTFENNCFFVLIDAWSASDWILGSFLMVINITRLDLSVGPS